MKKIVTHNAKFHTDDVFAVAALLILYPQAKIVRTRDEAVIKTADAVVDVGGVYNSDTNRFDHHQIGGAGERANGISYSSLGLVWKKFGEAISGSLMIMERIDRIFVQPIDASDNGQDLFTLKWPEVSPFMIGSVVDSFRLTWKETGNWDVRFDECVTWAKGFLQRIIKMEKDILEGEEIVRDFYLSSKDKRLIIIDDNYSFGRELVDRVLVGFPEPIYAVLFRRDHESWQLLAIRKKPGSFQVRKPLPESWRGKRNEDFDLATGISGGIFCHRVGFMCAMQTKEGALALAQKALEA